MRRKTNRNLKEKENLVNGSKDQAIKKLTEQLKEEASKIGLVVLEREKFIALAQCRNLLEDIAKLSNQEILAKIAMVELIKKTITQH